MDTNEYKKVAEDLGALTVMEAVRIAGIIDKKFVKVTKENTTKHILINNIERLQYKVQALHLMSVRHEEMITDEYMSEAVCQDLHIIAAIIYACNTEKEFDSKNEEAVKIVVDMHDMFHEELMNTVMTILRDTIR